jgi:hypothetical protein
MSISSVKTGTIGDSLLAGNAGYDPAATFLIQRQTLASNTASVTFSSIPSTYKHLQLRFNARGTRAAVDNRVYVRLNSDTGSNYSQHNLIGSGASASAAGAASQTYLDCRDVTGSSATSNIFGSGIIDLHDYSSTTKNTTARGVTGNDRNGSGTIALWSGAWLNTAAVSTILVFPESDNWLAGSTFALYGMVG